MAGRLSVEVKGLDDLIRRADTERAIRKPMRKGLREAAKRAKAVMVTVTRAISRRLSRPIRVQVDRAPVPRWATVTNRYAGAHAIDKGRRPRAKMPPVGRLRGGYAAALVVQRRGLPARPWAERARRQAMPEVNRVMREVAHEIERGWGRG